MNIRVNLLLCGLLCAASCEFVRQFHFVNVPLTWAEAQLFCRQHYTDLATVSSSEQMNRLLRPTSDPGDAWIGLSYTYVSYGNWLPQPSRCPGIYPWGAWFHWDCSSPHFFVCYSDVGGKQFFHITTGMTWPDARSFCRRHHTDLAVIESGLENSAVVALIGDSPGTHKNSWIGQLSVTRSWSDGSLYDFSHWLHGRPLEAGSSTCTVEDLHHFWRNESCGQTLPFFCHKNVIPVKKTVISFRSSLDMSNPSHSRMISLKIQDLLNGTELNVTGIRGTSPNRQHKKTELVDKKCVLSD